MPAAPLLCLAHINAPPAAQTEPLYASVQLNDVVPVILPPIAKAAF